MRKLIAKMAMVALAAFALGRAITATAQVAERTPVRIEVPEANNLQFFTLWVALGAGFFQQEGLEPKVLVDSTPRAAGQLLLRGQADVALLQPPMFLGMMAENKPIVLFASLLANEPINLIVRRDVAEARKLQANASLEVRLRAIAGLRVGVAGEPPPRLRALFESVRMNADKDVELVILHGPDQVQAFVDRKVDALFTHTPYLETALVKHNAFLLVEPSVGEVPLLADGQIHALATTRAFAREKAQVVLSVTRAIYRAERLIHSDPNATVDAILASGAAEELDRPLLQAITAVYGPAVPRTPAVSLTGIERDAVLFPARPRAPDFTRVKAADYVAPEFAARAVEAQR